VINPANQAKSFSSAIQAATASVTANATNNNHSSSSQAAASAVGTAVNANMNNKHHGYNNNNNQQQHHQASQNYTNNNASANNYQAQPQQQQSSVPNYSNVLKASSNNLPAAAQQQQPQRQAHSNHPVNNSGQHRGGSNSHVNPNFSHHRNSLPAPQPNNYHNYQQQQQHTYESSQGGAAMHQNPAASTQHHQQGYSNYPNKQQQQQGYHGGSNPAQNNVFYNSKSNLNPNAVHKQTISEVPVAANAQQQAHHQPPHTKVEVAVPHLPTQQQQQHQHQPPVVNKQQSIEVAAAAEAHPQPVVVPPPSQKAEAAHNLSNASLSLESIKSADLSMTSTTALHTALPESEKSLGVAGEHEIEAGSNFKQQASIELSTSSLNDMSAAASPNTPATHSPNGVNVAAVVEARRLGDMIQDEQAFTDKGDYYRHVVMAVDRLYPEAKFPLHDTWTFGYIRNDPSAKQWEDNIKEIIDVSYVEDFWAVATNMLTPSYLSNLGDLTFFKKGIRPMWEDAENKNGGSWLHQISGGGTQFKSNNGKPQPDIDECWMETLMALIGNNFCANNHLLGGRGDDSVGGENHIGDNISGLFLAHRGKAWKLALWTKNYKDEKTTRLIG
jgi:hypothetical protein